MSTVIHFKTFLLEVMLAMRKDFVYDLQRKNAIYLDQLKIFSFRHFNGRSWITVVCIVVGSEHFAVGSDVDCNKNCY